MIEEAYSNKNTTCVAFLIFYTKRHLQNDERLREMKAEFK